MSGAVFLFIFYHCICATTTAGMSEGALHEVDKRTMTHCIKSLERARTPTICAEIGLHGHWTHVYIGATCHSDKNDMRSNC